MNKQILSEIVVCMLVFAIVSSIATTVTEGKRNGATLNATATVDWWPMFRHDLTHTGNSTSTGPSTANMIWKYKTDHTVLSSPAIVDGKVYVGSTDKKLYCLDVATGKLIWSYPTGGFVFSSPAVIDGKIYIGSYDNKVYCLDAVTGGYIWNYTTGGFIASSPVVTDGKVYIGSFDNNVYCLNAINGNLIWNYPTSNFIHSSPAVADGKVYIGSYDTRVYCLDAATGNFIWSYKTGGMIKSSPAVVNGKVYIGSYDKKVYCLHAGTGAFQWSYLTGNWIDSSPAVANNKVYVGSADKKVYCFNAITGNLLWNYTGGNSVLSSPAVANGKVYVGVNDYNITCLNMDTGAVIWKYPIFSQISSSPAVAEGFLYIGSYDTYLYCFKENRPPAPPVKPSGPTEGEVDIEYCYKTNTADPEGDQVYYTWDFGDEVTGWIGPFESGKEVEECHKWSKAGTYNVKVKAKDVYNSLSNWSQPLTVTITKKEPKLEITIEGGKGITAVIQNTGDADATDISWSIHIDGGLFIIPRDAEGKISKLASGDSKEVTMSVFGIGLGFLTKMPMIQVNATSAEGASAKYSRGAQILFFKVTVEE